MTIYVYIEDGTGKVDGPFESMVAAAASPLWECFRSCVWIESKTRGGFFFENVRWTSDRGWFTTSRGVRPAQLFRPDYLRHVGEGRTIGAVDGNPLDFVSLRSRWRNRPTDYTRPSHGVIREAA